MSFVDDAVKQRVKVGPDDATLLFLGQGTVSPQWSIVPRCPWVLQLLLTMSDSWNCETSLNAYLYHMV